MSGLPQSTCAFCKEEMPNFAGMQVTVAGWHIARILHSFLPIERIHVRTGTSAQPKEMDDISVNIVLQSRVAAYMMVLPNREAEAE